MLGKIRSFAHAIADRRQSTAPFSRSHALSEETQQGLDVAQPNSKSGLENLHVDVLLLISECLDVSDRQRLGETNRYLRTLVTGSPSLWCRIRLQISGGETGHGNPRLPERRLPDTRFTPKLSTLRLYLSRSVGSKQEVHLELESLSRQQCLQIVDVMKLHAATIQALSVDANRSEEMEATFLKFAAQQLPNLRLLRITDRLGGSSIANGTSPDEMEVSAKEVYNLTMPGVLPHLETFYFRTSRPLWIQRDDPMISFLSGMKDFDVGYSAFRSGEIKMDAVRQMLKASRTNTKRAMFRFKVITEATAPSLEVLDLPLLEQLHLDVVMGHEGAQGQDWVFDLFPGLRLDGLDTLSLCARTAFMQDLHLSAPNLRTLSFEPWPHRPGDGADLGRYLAQLVSVERLELVAHKDYGTKANLCEFFRSFIQDALSGLPSAHASHLSPNHPVAMPRLRELSMRRFVSPRGGKDDWPANHVTRDTSLVLPLLLRRGHLLSLAPCPSYTVPRRGGLPPVELSTLPDLPPQYRTLGQIWAQRVTVKRFWSEVEMDLAMTVSEADRASLPLRCNEYDSFWDYTEPPIPRTFVHYHSS